ncbi:MAG: PstS family phosphate ABC transporter substrate-binding protein [Sumerlaeia bacterium]
MKPTRLFSTSVAVALFSTAFLASCSNPSGEGSAGDSSLSGNIGIDGSSTVFPITAAVAEEFQKAHPRVRIPVSYSGTGGGFKKFDLGETDINNASRPIKPNEIEVAAENNVDFIELPIAYDGLTVIIHPENDWVDYLSVDELRQIWSPDSTVKNWSDVRPEWPSEEIELYGAGPDSGTFDYFTEAINGESGASRGDYTATEDDNMTIQGVSGGKFATGYLGIAYFEQNKSRVSSVPIKNGDSEAVSASMETIMNSTYAPLSRPLFIYVRKDSADRPEVAAFIRYFLSESADLVSEVGYIPLPEKGYELALNRFESRITGTVFEEGVSTIGLSIEELLSSQKPTSAAE